MPKEIIPPEIQVYNLENKNRYPNIAALLSIIVAIQNYDWSRKSRKARIQTS